MKRDVGERSYSLNRLKSLAAFCPEILNGLQIMYLEVSVAFSLLDLGRGKGIHREFVKNKVLSDGYVCSALVDMYEKMKCGCLDMVKEVLEQMPRKYLCLEFTEYKYIELCNRFN